MAVVMARELDQASGQASEPAVAPWRGTDPAIAQIRAACERDLVRCAAAIDLYARGLYQAQYLAARDGLLFEVRLPVSLSLRVHVCVCSLCVRVRVHARVCAFVCV